MNKTAPTKIYLHDNDEVEGYTDFLTGNLGDISGVSWGDFSETSDDTAYIRQDIVEELLKALEHVEWINDGDEIGRYCAYCENYEHSGHWKGNCIIQSAIAEAKDAIKC